MSFIEALEPRINVYTVLLVHVVFVYMPLLSKMDLLSKMKLHYLMVLLVLTALQRTEYICVYVYFMYVSVQEWGYIASYDRGLHFARSHSIPNRRTNV